MLQAPLKKAELPSEYTDIIYLRKLSYKERMEREAASVLGDETDLFKQAARIKTFLLDTIVHEDRSPYFPSVEAVDEIDAVAADSLFLQALEYNRVNVPELKKS